VSSGDGSSFLLQHFPECVLVDFRPLFPGPRWRVFMYLRWQDGKALQQSSSLCSRREADGIAADAFPGL
jgi:hypothetical protein